jgi:hypothetical protein
MTTPSTSPRAGVSNRGGEASVPMRSVGRCDCRRGDQVKVFRVRRGAAGPIHRTHQGDGVVDHHCLNVCDPRLSIDLDRHSAFVLNQALGVAR